MTLKHTSKFITPKLDIIKDEEVREVVLDICHQLDSLYTNIYDDLKNNGLQNNNFDKNTIFLAGGLGLNRSAVSSSPYTVLSGDGILGVDTTAARTINLQAAATAGEGKILIIKDESGNATAQNITIDGNGSETIDGSATEVISTDSGYRILYCDGSNWHIIGSN